MIVAELSNEGRFFLLFFSKGKGLQKHDRNRVFDLFVGIKEFGSFKGMMGGVTYRKLGEREKTRVEEWRGNSSRGFGKMFTIIKTPSPITFHTKRKPGYSTRTLGISGRKVGWSMRDQPQFSKTTPRAAIHPPFADDSLRPFLDWGGEEGKRSSAHGGLKSLVDLIVVKKGLSDHLWGRARQEIAANQNRKIKLAQRERDSWGRRGGSGPFPHTTWN